MSASGIWETDQKSSPPKTLNQYVDVILPQCQLTTTGSPRYCCLAQLAIHVFLSFSQRRGQSCQLAVTSVTRWLFWGVLGVVLVRPHWWFRGIIWDVKACSGKLVEKTFLLIFGVCSCKLFNRNQNTFLFWCTCIQSAVRLYITIGGHVLLLFLRKWTSDPKTWIFGPGKYFSIQHNYFFTVQLQVWLGGMDWSAWKFNVIEIMCMCLGRLFLVMEPMVNVPVSCKCT